MLTGKKGSPPSATLPPDRRAAKGFFGRAAGSFVPKLTAKAFERFGFHSAEIMMNWPQIAGADLAAISKPERIRWPRTGSGGEAEVAERPGATLVLRVEPARALDIEYRAREIMDRINRYFGYQAVSALKILQAPLDEAKSRSQAHPRPAGHVPCPASVSTKAEPDVAEALAALWDSVVAQRRKR